MLVKLISAEETYDIRKEILRKNIPLTEKNKDDFEKFTFHLGAFVNDKLVGVSTFMQNDNQNFNGLQYRLRGMATLEEYQGQGLGKALILEAFDMLKKKRANVLWCNSRVVALDFYKKLGFKVIGSEFDIALIGPHYVMYKELKND